MIQVRVLFRFQFKSNVLNLLPPSFGEPLLYLWEGLLLVARCFPSTLKGGVFMVDGLCCIRCHFWTIGTTPESRECTICRDLHRLVFIIFSGDIPSHHQEAVQRLIAELDLSLEECSSTHEVNVCLVEMYSVKGCRE